MGEEEFRAFYGAEYAAVARYCWSLVRDRDLAHDLTQEAFTRTLARWIAVREPRAYVFLVATNLARATWSAQARHAETVTALGSLPPDDDDGPEAALGVRSAVDRLPRRLRDVVLLHYFAALPVSDIATAVRRPAGTVKRQLSEARALLAVDLGDVDA